MRGFLGSLRQGDVDTDDVFDSLKTVISPGSVLPRQVVCLMLVTIIVVSMMLVTNSVAEMSCFNSASGFDQNLSQKS